MDAICKYSSDSDIEADHINKEIIHKPVIDSTLKRSRKIPNPPKDLNVQKISRPNQEPETKKIRIVPHIEGNWATFVYVSCK